MNNTMTEVLEFIQENDVKFIRLAFCDIFGTQKNISIMPQELPRAFKYGISFDASAISGFMNVEASDLFLVPDPVTLSILPWRPSNGRVVRFFCDIKHPDGAPFEGDGRNILRKTIREAEALGYNCKIGSECEFYLFRLDERGMPTAIPYDFAGYCDIAPMDKGENVRREICLTLEEMGIRPESSHHEQGPGQNEVDFKYSDVLTAADNLVTFKSVVKTVAARNGLHASFMPKPLAKNSGSGLHINISLFKNGLNIFNNPHKEHGEVPEEFTAGVMSKIPEMTAFLNPLVNSYTRFGEFKAPKYITWSNQNRSQLIRIPAAEDEYCRIELRSPDPSCNPYLAFALVIQAGLEGIRKQMPLIPAFDTNLYEAEADKIYGLDLIPENLGAAIKIALKSTFIQQVLPQKTIDNFLSSKLSEWNRYTQEENKEQLEREMYFLKV
ncbi:MAG TPA: glutamine synthetase family protein [Desulfitobacteriaceae bacterium]|nr:glutamine synthetase family protein [Desulfitobacteriaceae bacterium]